VHEYSRLLKINEKADNPSFTVLSNRSAAYKKLQEYCAAGKDGLGVITLKPAWIKGYVQLVRTRIGCLNTTGALNALKQAQENLSCSDVDDMCNIEEKVQCLLAKGAPKRCNSA